jgi:nicotinate-nucleotide pyrophosphorylase (carboxylating)
MLGLLVDDIVKRALAEDLSGGDVTTEACIDKRAEAMAYGAARGPIVACGIDVARRAFVLVDPSVSFEPLARDGEDVEAGSPLFCVKGSARSILMAERTALNLIQRMSGISTTTRKYVDAVPPECTTHITDTRKTTPGLRMIERYAVRTGGGHNHRENLGAAVLIKDNHVAACGGIAQAISRARARAPHTSRIECEVDSLAQLDEALAAGADIVLLDNMDTETVKIAVGKARGKALTEASGGITLSRVTELARAGVDLISVGALTHSVTAADIGLDFS